MSLPFTYIDVVLPERISVIEVVEPRGLPGRPGKSAYEVAVANGFVGTEIEWLSSLQGGKAFYQHSQGLPSALWEIEHGLGFHPTVSVTDTAGDLVQGSVTHPTRNLTHIRFSAPFAGEAWLS